MRSLYDRDRNFFRHARIVAGWNTDAWQAPLGVDLLCTSSDFGERPIVAKLDGFNKETGEPIWLIETEDGPTQISVEAWRSKGSWRQ